MCRSQLSDCEGPFLGRSLKATTGQLTSAVPSLQSHRVKGKSKWLLTLGLCPCRAPGWCLRGAAD